MLSSYLAFLEKGPASPPSGGGRFIHDFQAFPKGAIATEHVQVGRSVFALDFRTMVGSQHSPFRG